MTNTRRGQTLVVFALTLLLLTLMVTMTLEIGQRVKDRTEAQVVADAAAYSEALTTARTFNGVAFLNRGTIASYVALLTTASLISNAGAQKGGGSDPTDSVNKKLPAKCQLPPGSIKPPPSTTTGDWDSLDGKAGAQEIAEQGAAGSMRTMGTQLMDELFNELDSRSSNNTYVARRIANLAYPNNAHRDLHNLQAAPLAKDADAASCTARKAHYEVNGACTGPKDDQYGNAIGSSDSIEALYAVMGSRGDGFSTNRSSVSTGFTSGSGSVISISQSAAGGKGGSGFGSPNTEMSDEGGSTSAGHEHTMAPYEAQRWCDGADGEGCVNGVVAWGVDPGGALNITVKCTDGSTQSFSVSMTDAYIGSSAKEYKDDLHWYQGSKEGKINGKPQSEVHTLGACTPYCPGVYGGITGYSSRVESAKELFGQPVSMPIIYRDWKDRNGGKGDVWNLNFKFKFTAVGERYNGGGPKDTTLNDKGMRNQVTMSSAIAYYHRNTRDGSPGGGARPGGAKYDEPPNFFNPFWRATLVSGHVYQDAYGGTGGEYSVWNVLKRSGFDTEGDMAQKLYQHGYRGF